MKLMFAILLLTVSGVANAGWTESWGKVEELMSHDGIHIIYTSMTLDTCGGKGNFWWPTDDSDADDMYAMAMAALVSGREIKVVHSPDSPECQFGHITKATHMRIR